MLKLATDMHWMSNLGPNQSIMMGVPNQTQKILDIA